MAHEISILRESMRVVQQLFGHLWPWQHRTPGDLQQAAALRTYMMGSTTFAKRSAFIIILNATLQTRSQEGWLRA
jgi:hypothetical protein